MNLKVSSPCIALALILIYLSATATEGVFLFVIAILLGIVAFIIAVFFYDTERHRNREIKPINGVVIVLAIFVCVSVCWFQWPLRVTYAASKTALNRLAAQLRRGKTIATPVHAGFFTIEKAEIRNNTACLWTRTNAGGDEGFIQVAPSKIEFSMFSLVVLDNQWQFITED